jgi:hypothetical protein
VREDTCANCNQRIYLVKTGPVAFKWVSDPDKPQETERCPADESQLATLPPRHHAPVSMREAHR